MANAAFLVIRAQPGADATARGLADLGLQAIVAPVLVLRPRAWPIPELAGAQAILATSAAAFAGLPAAGPLALTPVLAVGAATAAAARAAGFTHVHSADDDGAALLALAQARLSPNAGPVWHVSGAEVALDLAAALRTEGFSAARRVVYDLAPVMDAPPALTAALAAPDRLGGVLVHSQAAARAYLALTGAPAGVAAFCLSLRVAAPLAGRLQPIFIAPRPLERELLLLAASQPGRPLEPEAERD